MLNIVKIKKKDLISPNNPCIRNNDIKNYMIASQSKP